MKLTKKMAQQARKSVLSELLFIQRNWECNRFSATAEDNERELIEGKRLLAIAIAAVKHA